MRGATDAGQRPDALEPEPTAYEPPLLTWLGDVAELTQVKQVGAADGVTFLGIDIGSL